MSAANPVVHNPTTFVITDPALTADSVTAFRVLFGQTPGGPYMLTSADDALTNLTVNPDGTLTGTIAALNEQLAPGTWFAVAEAKNAAGYSANSPEASFVIDAPPPPVPSAPTGFGVA
jgi:hypothetical protein